MNHLIAQKRIALDLIMNVRSDVAAKEQRRLGIILAIESNLVVLVRDVRTIRNSQNPKLTSLDHGVLFQQFQDLRWWSSLLQFVINQHLVLTRVVGSRLARGNAD